MKHANGYTVFKLIAFPPKLNKSMTSYAMRENIKER